MTTTIKGRSTPAPIVETPRSPQSASPTPPQEQAALGGWQAKGAVRMPTSTLAQQHEMAVVCPVLGAMVKEGLVPTDGQGNVRFKDLRAAGAKTGMSGGLEALLPGIALAGSTSGKDLASNLLKRDFNVLELRSSFAKHASDSAILNSGTFDEARFDAFASHAKNGVMTESSFAAAIADQTRRDSPSVSAKDLETGTSIALVEYSLLLAMFGKPDAASGELGIPVSALKDLFQHQKLPQTTSASVPEMMSLRASMSRKVDVNLTAAAYDSTTTSTGQARLGIKLALGEDTGPRQAGAQAAMSAGRAAGCPRMAGGKPPALVKDALLSHR